MPGLVTVKDCVSQAAMEIGITQKPVSIAVGSLDQDVAQMTALLSAVADEVLMEEPYKRTLGDGYWLVDVTGQPLDRPSADTDLIAFDGRLAVIGLKYRFLKAKGLEFGEEMRDFLSRMNKLASRQIGRVLDLDTDVGRVQ